MALQKGKKHLSETCFADTSFENFSVYPKRKLSTPCYHYFSMPLGSGFEKGCRFGSYLTTCTYPLLCCPYYTLPPLRVLLDYKPSQARDYLS